jgi:hypothetical protein
MKYIPNAHKQLNIETVTQQVNQAAIKPDYHAYPLLM